jgi:hypothetical protein
MQNSIRDKEWRKRNGFFADATEKEIEAVIKKVQKALR